MSTKQKLELTWIGKEKRPKLEPRILVEVPEKSYHAKEKHSESDLFENMLIHGDNLLALKALEQKFEGQVKCIYIDPPFNTGNAFEYYDDGLEHSIWLNLMYLRLLHLQKLLSRDGVIAIECDKNEDAYLKIICDEIFGRDNFINSITIQSSTPSGTKLAHRNKTILKTKDTLLIYKNGGDIEIKPQYIPTDNLTNFNYWLENKDGHYTVRNLKDVLIEHNIIKKGDSIDDYKLSAHKDFETFILQNKEQIFRKQPSLPDDIKQKSKSNPGAIISYHDNDGQIFLAQNGYRFAFLASAVREYNGSEKVTQLLCDIWTDISFHGTQYEGPVSFPAGKKPEALIHRILDMFTKPGDLVLDSFLGSGTTAAVAHKMGRRWIGIELRDHCYTHCYTRLKSVIDGTDSTGITKRVNWRGGGGFRFYELGASLIQQDQWGQPVINPEFNAEMLAQALCKLEGFTYNPSKEEYFIHGYSSERDFIYVTTNYMRTENLQSISHQLGDNRSLLICCRGFNPAVKFDNLTVKKIPKAVLDKCEWGHDDYSLNIKNLPMSVMGSAAEQGDLFENKGDE